MATKFASAAEDELACPVCFQFYAIPHEPKNLPKCAHILCRLCLQKMTEGLKTIKCPICNKVSTLPEEGIDGLTTNLVAKKLAEKHPKGIGQRKEQIQDAEERVVKRLKEAKESEEQIQHSIELEKREVEKSVEHINAQASAKAEELVSQITSLSGLLEIKQHVAELKTRVKNISTSQSKLEAMPDDEFCTQTDALVSQLKNLQVDSTPNIKTNHCLSKFIADEHVQLGRIVKTRQLELIQEFGKFQFVTDIASNSNGMLAVCDCKVDGYILDCTDTTVTLFYNENLQYKIQSQVKHKLATDGLVNIALDGQNNYCVTNKCKWAGFDVYSSDGKYQKRVNVIHPKQQETNLKTKTLCIMNTTDNKILTWSNLIDFDNNQEVVGTFVTIHDIDYTLLKIVEIGITDPIQVHMADVSGTHVAVSRHIENKVHVYNLESGNETLNLDIRRPTSLCYDRQSDCLLIARSMREDPDGGSVAGFAGIDQYCLATGKLVACLAEEVLYPNTMRFVNDNTIAIANICSVKLCKISDEKLTQPQAMVNSLHAGSIVCSNPICGAIAYRVPGGLKKCACCHIAAYCGRRCQAQDWRSHKTVCGKQ